MIKSHPTCKTENLIHLLNSKIRGWSNYFKHAVSQQTFDYVDNQIFWASWAWAKRRHPNRSKKWIWSKYFQSPAISGNLSTIVMVNGEPKVLSLAKATTTPIRRHIKIKGHASPYDPQFEEYFKLRIVGRKNREKPWLLFSL